MRKILMMICLKLFSVMAWAQTGDDGIWPVGEQNAEYPGGMTEMKKYLDQNTCYPASAIKAGVEGRVYIEFIVTATGAIDSVHIKKGLHPDLDKIAMSAVKKMPEWKPARYNGKTVRQKWVLPVAFKIHRIEGHEDFSPRPCMK